MPFRAIIMDMDTRTEEAYRQQLEAKDAIIAALMTRLADTEKERDEYKKKYNDLLARRFRKASEMQKKNPDTQLFDESETVAGEGAVDEERKNGDGDIVDKGRVRKYVRHKSRNTVLSAPAGTPVIEHRLEFRGGECPECGHELFLKGYKASDRITRYTVTAIIRTLIPVAGCGFCGKETTEEGPDMLADTACDPSFLASVVTSKMRDGLPLYRQEGEYLPGMNVSRQLLSSWMMYAGGRITDNLIPLLEEEVMSMPLVNSDETGLNVVYAYFLLTASNRGG